MSGWHCWDCPERGDREWAAEHEEVTGHLITSACDTWHGSGTNGQLNPCTCAVKARLR